MNKIDPAVKKETLYILVWCALLSVVTQAVFLALQKWDYTVLLGSILAIIIGVGNFFLMGITVQKAVLKSQDEAGKFIKVSQMLRMFAMVVMVIGGVVLPCFHMWSLVAGLFFPRVAIMLRPLVAKK